MRRARFKAREEGESWGCSASTGSSLSGACVAISNERYHPPPPPQPPCYNLHHPPNGIIFVSSSTEEHHLCFLIHRTTTPWFFSFFLKLEFSSKSAILWDGNNSDSLNIYIPMLFNHIYMYTALPTVGRNPHLWAQSQNPDCLRPVACAASKSAELVGLGSKMGLQKEKLIHVLASMF